ncbi:MFS transporter [Agriterribacter sp.]|uniref:MFS transporter n=1 Tax=Agriterribacter sp. TaxID=2821509 RepID=UPI002C801F96|nr:MFS transporter [Agriterribacter sp.]HRO44608.1 MFS transporter [Agriterribacter sp.]HRQ16045.1 MFS transporter [Agriterribacter sp.]
MTTPAAYNKTTLFIAACCGLLLFGIALLTLGSVSQGLQQNFKLDKLEAGTLFAILPAGLLTGSLFFGPVCDRYGYKVLLVTACILLATGFTGIAYSPSTGWLQFSIFIFGLAGGIINGATNAVVADISGEYKGANLSLLGVSFGVGALGLPFVLGILKQHYTYPFILSGAAVIALLVALFYLLIRFPLPKITRGVPLKKSFGLLKDMVLLLIAFYLFCQSSLEAIVNNWTTTFLIERKNLSDSNALYALSACIAGMTLMRLLTGTIFREITAKKILLFSFGLFLCGIVLLQTTASFFTALSGLLLLGAGIAGGFPIMLGLVGSRYAALSGTAFSLVLVIAITGNILVNYLMGIVAETYGIQHFITLLYVELGVMVLLFISIFKKIK